MREKAEIRRRIAQAASVLANSKIEPERFPWREVKSPYRTFLSEFLLVRTRADIVAKHFENIIGRYPDACSLAAAEEDELAETLAPLGLRKRVPLIISAAKTICERYGGSIPEEYDELLKIPGIGSYVATCIRIFAFDDRKRVPADVNVLRFLSRLIGSRMKHPTKGSPVLYDYLSLLSEENTGLKAEVLLDFTRTICRPVRPRCGECPVREICLHAKIDPGGKEV
mgnify:CR=1 FL=1